MNIFTIFFGQNCSKIYSKTHQFAPFIKEFPGEHALNQTPLQTRGFAMQIAPLP